MQDFLKKHKEELKKPLFYIGVGALVFIMGAISGNLENTMTVILGGGCLVFGIRDIVALYLEDK